MNENNYQNKDQNPFNDHLHDDHNQTVDPEVTQERPAYNENPPSADSVNTAPSSEWDTESSPAYNQSASDTEHMTDPSAAPAPGEPAFGGAAVFSGSGEAKVDYNIARGASMTFDAPRDYDHQYDNSDDVYDDYETASYEEGGSYNDGYDSSSDYGYSESGNPSSGAYTYGSGEGRPDSRYAHQQYTSAPYTRSPNPSGTQRKRKKKKSSSSAFDRFLASLIVIVLCGMAGFGGATLAYRNASHNSHQATSNVNITGDVTSANAASVIAEKVMPSVVGISTIAQSQRETIFGLQSGTVQGIGTGIIVSEDGYILTNSHVVNDGNTQQITVDLYDGTEYSGTVLWNDSSLDLAIVKIDTTGLTAAEIGDSDDVIIGDYALAIGNPLGLNYERSVTSGIISGLNRSITTQDESTGKTNKMDGLIQTDAAINSGNSGGPLINSSGQVIGINTAKASSSEGLGFAIPINTATPIIKQVKDKGSYEQTYIGISGVDLTTIATNYATDFKADNGVFIMQIYTDSPAAAAGLKEGDIITEIDGKSIDGMSALKSRLINYSPGDTIELTIEREKDSQKISLTLGSSADATSSIQTTPDNSSSNGSGSYGYGGYGGSGTYGSSGSGGLGGLFGQ